MTDTTPAFYIQFSENNDYEGETWHRYIPVAGNEKAIERLRELVNAQEPDAEEDEDSEESGGPFGLREGTLTETEVDVLVKYANDDSTTYSAAHGKLEGILDLDGLLSSNRVANIEDLYKLQIEARMRPPRDTSPPEG